MFEPDKYISRAENFELRLTGRDQEEIYRTYDRLPHKPRNEVPRSGKTSYVLTHALHIIIL